MLSSVSVINGSPMAEFHRHPGVGMLRSASTALPLTNRGSYQLQNRRSKRRASDGPSLYLAGATVGHSPYLSGVSLGRGVQFSNGSRWSLVWVDSSAQVEADVPISEAWDLWSDREGVSRWMPWIHSVKVLEDKPAISRWTLKTSALGQNLEFSWLSRNMKPNHHQKIHWRSVDGLPNKGVVRFYPRTPSSCGVQLTISFEVPDVLAGLGSAVSPLVSNIIQQDMERFAKFAKKHQLESQPKQMQS